MLRSKETEHFGCCSCHLYQLQNSMTQQLRQSNTTPKRQRRLQLWGWDGWNLYSHITLHVSLLAHVSFQHYERSLQATPFLMPCCGGRTSLSSHSHGPQCRLNVAAQKLFCALTLRWGKVGALVAACLTMVEHQRVRQENNCKQMRDLQET